MSDDTDVQLARYDERIKAVETDVHEIKNALMKQDEKLDELLGYAKLARGLGWGLFKLGAVITGFAYLYYILWTVWPRRQ